MASLRYPD